MRRSTSDINAVLSTVFDDNEMAMVWAALLAYNVVSAGDDNPDPKLVAELEERRARLVEVFE